MVVVRSLHEVITIGCITTVGITLEQTYMRSSQPNVVGIGIVHAVLRLLPVSGGVVKQLDSSLQHQACCQPRTELEGQHRITYVF
jgi:hypothetical protein